MLIRAFWEPLAIDKFAQPSSHSFCHYVVYFIFLVQKRSFFFRVMHGPTYSVSGLYNYPSSRFDTFEHNGGEDGGGLYSLDRRGFNYCRVCFAVIVEII